MRFILSTLAVLAALVLIAVSGSMNFLFMQGMGKDETESLVLGAASVAIDIFKAILPVLIWWSYRESRLGFMTTAIAMFAVFTVFSLTSAIGFSATNRGHISGIREGANAQLEAVMEDLKVETAKLEALPQHRPAPILEQQINRVRTDRLWSRTKQCTDATLKQSRAFCDQYFSLKSELESAILAERIERRLKELKRSEPRLKRSGAGTDADPQVTVLARLSGNDESSVRTALIIFIAALLEIGSGLGLWMATGHSEIFRRHMPARHQNMQRHAPVMSPVTGPVMSAETIHAAALEAMPVRSLNASATAHARQTQIADIEDYILDRVRPTAEGGLTMADLFADYQSWIAALHKSEATQDLFKTVVEKIMIEVGIQTEGAAFPGIGFAPDALAGR